jgi:hypothetical protein
MLNVLWKFVQILKCRHLPFGSVSSSSPDVMVTLSWLCLLELRRDISSTPGVIVTSPWLGLLELGRNISSIPDVMVAFPLRQMYWLHRHDWYILPYSCEGCNVTDPSPDLCSWKHDTPVKIRFFKGNLDFWFYMRAVWEVRGLAAVRRGYTVRGITAK